MLFSEARELAKNDKEREAADNPQEDADAPGSGPNDDTQDAESSWNLLLDGLGRVLRNGRWNQSFKLATLRTWVMRVARFSFSVQPK